MEKILDNIKNQDESEALNNRESISEGVITNNIKNQSESETSNNSELNKYIISFAEASIEDGGSGAFYIYLKKNK